MATLWIREYAVVGRVIGAGGNNVGAQIAQEPGIDQTPLTFSTSAASAAFGSGTQYIAIYGSAAFHYVVGSTPTATTGALKIAADTLLFIGVTSGQKIAAIAAV